MLEKLALVVRLPNGHQAGVDELVGEVRAHKHNGHVDNATLKKRINYFLGESHGS